MYQNVNFLTKPKPKEDVDEGKNRFIEWLDFYLRRAVIISSFDTLDVVLILYHISVMIIACTSGWYMFYIKYDDLSQNTDVLLHAVLVGHTLYVYLVYLTKRKSLFTITNSMQDKFKIFSDKLNLEEYHHIWDEADKLSLALMKLGSASCILVYLSYILNSVMSPTRQLLYPLWIPFSLDSNFNYAFTLAVQFTVFSLYSFIHVSGCGICIGGSHFLGASFRVLACAFQDLCEMPKTMNVNSQLQRRLHQANVEEKIKWCLKTHVSILRIAKEYKAVYEEIIVEVLLSCEITICFAGFQIVLAIEAKDYPRAGALMCMALLIVFHLFMFCYPGQHIFNKSEEFRESLYQSEWFTQSLSVQKSIHIMLTNTRTPVSISYRGIIHATMPSFLNALRTAFSYVNILMILRGVR